MSAEKEIQQLIEQSEQLEGREQVALLDRAALTQAMTDIVQLSVASASDRIQGESA